MLENEIKAIIAKELEIKVEEIHNNDEFIETLCADSLDMVELAMKLEERYNISVPDEDLKIKNLITVNDIIKYVEMKTQ